MKTVVQIFKFFFRNLHIFKQNLYVVHMSTKASFRYANISVFDIVYISLE